MATTLKVCPNCRQRALAPFLGPKRRCKACGAYVDMLDLLLQQASGPPGPPEAAVARQAPGAYACAPPR